MLTLSAIKADVGSVGGHTRPSMAMIEGARTSLEQATKKGVIIDYDVTYTGDDICLLMVHGHGQGDPNIHDLAWRIFEEMLPLAMFEEPGLGRPRSVSIHRQTNDRPNRSWFSRPTSVDPGCLIFPYGAYSPAHYIAPA
jgi:hypothetical protein